MRQLIPALLLITRVSVAQTWTQLPDFPGSARDDAASFTIANKVYVGTGMDVGFQLTNDWYAFDTMTETWDTIASLPAASRQYCSGFALNDHGYLFGGLSSAGPLNELWRYDPVADSWEQVTSLPAAGRYASAVVGSSEQVCITTGMLAGGLATNETWCYDAVNDSWTGAAPAPAPPRHRAAATMGLLIGGADEDYNSLTDVHEYWSWNDTWHAQVSLPDGRYSADAIQSILVGGASSASTLHNTCWSNSWTGDEWITTYIPDFPGGIRRSGVTGEDLFIVDAGAIYYGTGSDNVQRYRDWWKLLYAVGITDKHAQAFSLSPIPADAELRLDIATMTNLSSWQVWSLDARLVAQGPMIATSTVIPTAAFPTGAYILRLGGIHSVAATRFTVTH